jgi:hypothetical protein
VVAQWRLGQWRLAQWWLGQWRLAQLGQWLAQLGQWLAQLVSHGARSDLYGRDPADRFLQH